MKRIFLYAYDKINLGDDLFISFITNRYPDIYFIYGQINEIKGLFRI